LITLWVYMIQYRQARMHSLASMPSARVCGLFEHVATTSNSERLKVLLVEDNPGDARLIRELLAEQRGANFDVLQVDRLAPGLALTAGPIDAVLLDLNLPDSQGLATFRRLHTTAAWLPIVVLSGLADEAVAVQAVREGAQDYLVKGSVDGAALGRAVRYAVERQRTERALRLSEERLRLLAQAGIVLGASLDDLTILRGVADLTVPVFADCCLVDVVDESGTITRVAAAFGDLAHQDLAPVLLQRDESPSVPVASSGVHRVVATGRPELRPRIAPEELGTVFPLLGMTAGEAASEALQRLNPRGHRCVVVLPRFARRRAVDRVPARTRSSVIRGIHANRSAPAPRTVQDRSRRFPRVWFLRATARLWLHDGRSRR
jgi:CheY-like chemotaxis protein